MTCTQFAGTHQFLSPEVISDDMDAGYDGIKGTNSLYQDSSLIKC